MTAKSFIPKARLDALTDGVFAVAMTLLVIDLRLPESFNPKDAAELLHRLTETWNQVLVYALSFYVLGLRWIGMVQLTPRGEEVSEQYIRWSLAHLLLITFVPFSTMVVGRYVWLAPAVWLYAANTIAFALVAIRMISLTEPEHARAHDEDRFGLIVLIGASFLAVAISLFAPRYAMLGFLANAFDNPLRRLTRRRKAASS